MKFNPYIYSIYKDQFNFYNLIKLINRNYRLYFNKINKKFYILNIKNNYETCFSFNSFSEQILQLLQFTQVTNFKKIINHIEESNKSLEEKQNLKFYNQTSFSLNEFKNLNNRSTHINKSDIDKIIGATQC